MNNRSELLREVGTVVGTHGLRGDLKVRLSSDDSDLLLIAESFFLRLPRGELLRVNPARQSLHKGQVLLRLQGYDSIDQVEPLVGSSVLLAEDQFPALAEDEYYWHQLDGLQVVDLRYGPIGVLQSMFTTAAHDTYVVNGEYGEVLIPAVGRFILEIDLQERIMKVDLPEGLVPQK
jgi:16S rRNA processing protein RimM